MKVYFSHGKESGPWGSKIKRLAAVAKNKGLDIDSIDYTSMLNPDDRVEHLVRILEQAEGEFILVGSSMGGYVSLVASEQVNTKGVFLLAPALFMPGYQKQRYSNSGNVEIVHGWSDDVIPPLNSINFAKNTHCPLHLIPGDHRLNSSMDIIEYLFTRFLMSMENGHVL